MRFTYSDYENMLKLLLDNGYAVADYNTHSKFDKCAILRHDIDYDLEKALPFAKLEKECGVKSTYFVLVTSDFYNVFSSSSQGVLNSISGLGHNIGLHFDEVRYPDLFGKPERLKEKILIESELLSKATGLAVESVSMHRPSKQILEANISIPGIVNSYSDEFFKNFKYLSDSRRNWREPIEEIIKNQKYARLHILTHAFWYAEKNMDINETIRTFVFKGNISRFDILSDNISNLDDILRREEIL